eukprot:scaffold133216_cov57-Phaeocystis_antarctica.AAC.2
MLLLATLRHLAERRADGAARLAVLVVAVVAPLAQLGVEPPDLLVRAWPLGAHHPEQARVLRLGERGDVRLVADLLGQAQHARHHRGAPRDQLVVQQLRVPQVLARRQVLCALRQSRYAHGRRSAQPFR